MKRKCAHRGTLRLKVSMFLDIPAIMNHGLSKTALRSKDVRSDGVDWPNSLLYCTRCGWMERRPK